MEKRLIILLLLFTGTITGCKKAAEAKEAVVAAPETPGKIPRKAKRFSVDTTASVIDWAGSKPTGRHTGTILLRNGFIFIKDSIEGGYFTIDMESISVTDQAGEKKLQLENHLKGKGKEADADHFFNTPEFPEGKFVITSVTSSGSKTMIEGNLTLKSITRNIKFPVQIDLNDTLITLVSDPFKINRTLWNITYSSKSAVANLGDKYIDDDIEIKVRVAARRQKH